MNFPLSFVVFMFVLFSYIHINDQYKKSQDLEIYELEYKGIENLQETCDVKQPVVFNFAPMITKYAPINLDVLSSIEKEDGNTLNVKDTVDYYNVSESNEIIPTEVPLPFHNTIQLIKTDNSTTPHFFTENNNEFIEETGIESVMLKIGNVFLKPSYTMNQTFDIMTAGKGVGLPMRYHTYTRKYIYVSTGKIVVKMAPFKNVKKLDFNKLLVSPMNCWNPQQKFISHINKIRFLEFDITKGHILYVPPYWIYSILYDEHDTCLLEYNYQTAINILAHPHSVINSLKNAFQTAIGSFGGSGGGNYETNKKKGGEDKNRNLRKEMDTDTDDETESITESNDDHTMSTDYDLSVVTKPNTSSG